MGAKAYFFKADRYLRYDIATDRVDDGYPLRIADHWPGFGDAGFSAKLDAAVDWRNGQAFFFNGERYLRFNVRDDKVDDGYPLRTAEFWNGLAAAGFANGIDAAINWGDGNVYLFRGDQYVRFSVADDRVADGYPLRIADHWNGMAAAGFGSGLDAAINWGNGKAYFFKGEHYVRFSIKDDSVDDGYPLRIADHWPGFAAAGFGSGVKASISLSGVGRPTPLTADLPDSFFAALSAMCARLGCLPAHLLLVMFSESGVRASAMHPSGKAAGISQLAEGTLPGVGWSHGCAAFAQLSAEAQLPFVERFFAQHAAIGLDSMGRLYQLNFLPATARAGQGPDTVLAERDGQFANFYQSNQILDADHDGRITIGDLEAAVLRHRGDARWKEIESRIQ